MRFRKRSPSSVDSAGHGVKRFLTLLAILAAALVAAGCSGGPGREVDWATYRSEGDSSLAVSVQLPMSGDVTQTRVTENADSVMVEIWCSCSGNAGTGPTETFTVELREPLGSRPVTDSTGKALRQGG